MQLSLIVIQYKDSNNARIYWYSDSPGNSIVYWGLDTGTSNTTAITESTNFHTVELHDLTPETFYYFKVRTEGVTNATSTIDSFTTPLLAIPFKKQEILYEEPEPFIWWTPNIHAEAGFRLKRDGSNVVNTSGIYPTGLIDYTITASGIPIDGPPFGFGPTPSGSPIPSGNIYGAAILASGVLPTGINPSGILVFDTGFPWEDGSYEWFIKGSEVEGGNFVLNLPDPVASVALSFIPASIPISQSGIARALVLEDTGNPGVNREVLWSISEGSITSSSFTDENGIAEATITRTNNGGFKIITAICEGKIKTGQVYWEFGTPATIVVMTNKNTVEIVNDQIIVTVKILDEFGNRVTRGYNLRLSSLKGLINESNVPVVIPVINGIALATYKSSIFLGIDTIRAELI